MAEGSSSVSALHWWKFSLRLRQRGQAQAIRAHPLIIIRALLLEAVPADFGLDPVYRVRREAAFALPLQAGETLDVDVILAGADASALAGWYERLISELSRPQQHFALEILQAPQWHDAGKLAAPQGLGEEICLHFDTPFAFDHSGPAGTLSFAEFRRILERRLRRAYPQLDLQLPATELIASSEHWQLERNLRHVSRSQGQPYALIGCRGPYYLRGDIAPWWPWLKLAEQLNLGKRLPFGLGQFRLLQRPQPTIAARLDETGLLRHALEQVLDHHDDMLAQLAASSPSPFDAQHYCRQLALAIAEGRFDPGCYEAVDLHKPDGGTRRIELPGPDALIVATHLLHLLEPRLECQFEPQSYGFRKGRSREDAAAAIDAALEQGYRHVLETDIADFFGCIDHAGLSARLRGALAPGDGATVELAMRLVTAPQCIAGVAQPRTRGIPQGLPLSPLLANLYLDPLDEWLAAHDVRAVRYADDIVVLCRSEAAAVNLLAALQQQAGGLKLGLAAAKTHIGKAADGFQFLGLRFPRGAAETPWRVPLRRALHVVEPFLALGVRGDALEIRHAGQLHDLIPLRRLDRILLHAPAVLSTALLRRAAAQPEPVVIVSGSARSGESLPLGAQSAAAFDTAHRQMQRHAGMSEAERDVIAREWVVAKIENAAAFLRTRYQPGMNQRLQKLQSLATAVHAAADIDAIRGLEGAAAREVFAQLNALIEVPEFRFRRRDRGEHDRMNPLFNFGYYLLLQQIQLELRGLGLNPYLGFLHRPDSGRRYEALACDVQEPFRCHIDRLLLRLINLKALRPAHIDLDTTPPRIAPEALRLLAIHFERELATRLPQSTLTLADAITAQCLNLRDFLCEGRSFHAFRWAAKKTR